MSKRSIRTFLVAIVLALAAGAAAQIVPPPPGATVIDFDDDSSAGCAFFETTALRGAYAGLGVTFGAPGNDGGAVLNQCGNFSVTGHSAPNFLAFNDGATMGDGGIPRTPETLTFAPLVSAVQLNVGSGLCTLTVTAIAYDDADNVLTSASLPAGSTLATLSVAAPAIRRVKLTTDHACAGKEVFVGDDLAFTVNVCGNGTIDAGEQCDVGAANGTPASCCALDCMLRTASHTCRPASSDCDAAEVCDGVSVACPPDAPAPAGTSCAADGAPCTNDVCDGAGACTHPFAPAASCVSPSVPGGAQLKISAKSDPLPDQVRFKWKKGPVVQVGDFGDPSTFAPVYGLCVYDPVLGLVYHGQPTGPCGTSPCWTQNGTGWKFKSASGVPDGITQVKLKGSTLPLKAQIQVKAKPTSLAAELDLMTPVTAQLRTSDGRCWGATFSSAIKDVAGQFKAKSD